MVRRSALVVTAVLALAVLFAACGKSNSSSSGGSGAAPASCRKAQDGTVDLKAKNIAWDTDCLEVSGTSLTIVEDNQDQVDHPLKVKGLPGSTKGGPGTEALKLTDLKPGKYDYICELHANMTGTLYVTAGGPSSGAAPAPAATP